MRVVLRIALWFVWLVLGLLVAATIASVLFNLATSGEGKPASSLWHGRVVQADGVRTAYRQWGSSGSPIVLIGGFVEPSFVWNTVGPMLARSGHRVYALDLDGFGYSERRGPWTVGEWGDQVQAFMRRLHIARPVVVGHSLGAAVAVDVARRGIASRIVLLDGDALSTDGIPWLAQVLLAHSPFITSGLRLATRWDWPASVLLARAYGPQHPPLTHAVVSRWTRPFEITGSDHAIATMAKHPLPGVSRAVLQGLHTRATVVWGDQDEVDDRTVGRQTAGDLRAPFVLIHNAGHLSMLSNPGAVTRAIEQ